MDTIYAKEDFGDADGERVGELQIVFEEMNGWNADSDAAALLSNLGILKIYTTPPWPISTGYKKYGYF